MGEERDKLIRRLGGTPVADQDISDEELAARRMEYYAGRGRLPPEIEAIRNLLVGYGTLLSRESVARTVGDAALRKAYVPVIVPGYRRLFNLRPEEGRGGFGLQGHPAHSGEFSPGIPGRPVLAHLARPRVGR